MNFNHLLEQAAAERGGETALRHPGGDVDYKTFSEAVARLARGLHQLGINRGDRVAVMLPNLPQFPIAYYAILRIGAVVVPVNMMFKGREILGLLEDSEVKALIAWHGIWGELARQVAMISSVKHVILLGEQVPPGILNLTRLIATSRPLPDIAELDDDDPMVIQYSSGASGGFKGAELTLGNILSNVKAVSEIMRVVPGDAFLAALPLFHPLGQTVIMHAGLLAGAQLVLQPRVDGAAMAAVLRDGSVSVFIGVPSLFQMVLGATREEDPPPEKPVRLCVCGGGAIPEETLKDFEKRFGTYILECYTVSEASPVTSFNQWRTGRRVGSLGHPIPGTELKVADEKGYEAAIGQEGEIIIKGANVMRRYVNRPQLTAETLRDGWLHTGDMGKMDINGFFYLVDRKDDRIVKAGFSIYPTEIETVLHGHPEIADVAVVGVPDEKMGEEVKACVVLKEGATVTTDQLTVYCLERMAIYKVPTVIRFYKDLPHTSTGRINRRELRG
jgi:long-chain acyl-CoA synthetase